MNIATEFKEKIKASIKLKKSMLEESRSILLEVQKELQSTGRIACL